jgi:hypothetical protein
MWQDELDKLTTGFEQAGLLVWRTGEGPFLGRFLAEAEAENSKPLLIEVGGRVSYTDVFRTFS